MSNLDVLGGDAMTNKKEIEVIPLYYDYILTRNYPVNILVGGR